MNFLQVLDLPEVKSGNVRFKPITWTDKAFAIERNIFVLWDLKTNKIEYLSKFPSYQHMVGEWEILK